MYVMSPRKKEDDGDGYMVTNNDKMIVVLKGKERRDEVMACSNVKLGGTIDMISMEPTKWNKRWESIISIS